ncbi:MAG: ATP-dependent metallopeptidase FtsH/Yme1/Tma family protein [Rickettsiales bacterium]|nr:ATP-dependent metallopeptidase FtsH/Yme1/Tma family protein [Rickettsiales bacterium]
MNFKRNIIIWLAIILGAVIVFDIIQKRSGENVTDLSFSDFLNKVEKKEVSSVVIRGHNVEGKLSDGNNFITYIPNYPNLVDVLKNNKVAITAAPIETKMSSFITMIISWLPMILLIGVWIFFMRQMGAGAGKAMGFGRSRAQMQGNKLAKITFADVAGIDEAQEELVELVEFLKNPKKFQALGGRIPRGCILIGPPGTGKTLIARAVAGEANVPFFTISGSDFVEMFVGVGASRVRDMFAQGKKNAPCIIFIDEIDAVGRHRGVGIGGGNDEREQTLNQLLVEMDGFQINDSIIIIAATNRPDVLDPALMRPGRFDRQIFVSAPDVKGREAILEVHAKKIVMAPGVSLKTIAKGTPGFTGADLANLVNESALLAARRNKKIVTIDELEEARDKVMMGPQRKSMMMSEEEKRITAYHEGGHALVTLHCPEADPIHKATIVPRGRALGMVMRLPESETSKNREKFEADIAIAMGGRAAEEIILGHKKVTSGAAQDIKAATAYARAMVREWGMSDKVGPLYYGGNSQDVYAHQQQKMYSSNTEDLIDKEVKSLVDNGYKLAHKILTTHKNQLHKIAKALLTKETLTGDELYELAFGKKKKNTTTTKKSSKDLPTTKKDSKEKKRKTSTSKKSSTSTRKTKSKK